RLAEGKDQSAEHEELEKQQQVLAELLERRIDLQVLDGLAPQQRRGNLELDPLKLEKVEQQQRRHGQRCSHDQRCGSEESQGGPILSPVSPWPRPPPQQQTEQQRW